MSESKIFGFMGAPGLGKTVAMNIVENAENLKELKNTLGMDKDLTVDVVKKSTSRPNRGADDRLKISGIPESEFVDHADQYIGEYILQNNGAKYAYHVDEINKNADILVAEPSIHHLSEIKQHLKDRLVTILIVADTNYRETRMNGRGTEETSQIHKRLVEGDVQIYVASKLSGEKSKELPNLIHNEGLKVYEDVYNAEEANLEDAKKEMEEYFKTYIGGEDIEKFAKDSVKEYTNIIRKAKEKEGQNLFDHIIVRSLEDDKEAGDDFLVKGKFKDDIVTIIKDHLANDNENQ